MSLTTRGRGAYTRGGGGGGLIFGRAYIGVEKRVTNLGGLYLGEFIHGGRGLFTEFYGNIFIFIFSFQGTMKQIVKPFRMNRKGNIYLNFFKSAKTLFRKYEKSRQITRRL